MPLSEIQVPSLSAHDTASLQAKAAQFASPAFLDGFATKCAAEGMTLDETLAAYSGVEKAALLIAKPHRLSGMLAALSKGGAA